MSNNYASLRRSLEAEPGAAERCAERLLRIRESLAPIRARKSGSLLWFATRSIRDFESSKFNSGP